MLPTAPTLVGAEPLPWLVDWWDVRNYYIREAADLAHQQRLVSPELLAMFNRPQSVVDLQALHDRVYFLMGVK